MRFYDREEEIRELRAIRERSREAAQWTVVTGRRRVGKTALVQEALGDEPYVYFYAARRAEADLCEGKRGQTPNQGHKKIDRTSVPV